eukprot:TRINITY_DN680_c1_g3_i1.p2 TRINITY_DN680_c1_g3~~TRINITY_DN680_c1_g3_i1.p2  ORF type:complete len:579 (+),score=198.94 TRINITY_DN680_c1_g3_i1:2781-4517(+)
MSRRRNVQKAACLRLHEQGIALKRMRESWAIGERTARTLRREVVDENPRFVPEITAFAKSLPLSPGHYAADLDRKDVDALAKKLEEKSKKDLTFHPQLPKRSLELARLRKEQEAKGERKPSSRRQRSASAPRARQRKTQSMRKEREETDEEFLQRLMNSGKEKEEALKVVREEQFREMTRPFVSSRHRSRTSYSSRFLSHSASKAPKTGGESAFHDADVVRSRRRDRERRLREELEDQHAKSSSLSSSLSQTKRNLLGDLVRTRQWDIVWSFLNPDRLEEIDVWDLPRKTFPAAIENVIIPFLRQEVPKSNPRIKYLNFTRMIERGLRGKDPRLQQVFYDIEKQMEREKRIRRLGVQESGTIELSPLRETEEERRARLFPFKPTISKQSDRLVEKRSKRGILERLYENPGIGVEKEMEMARVRLEKESEGCSFQPDISQSWKSFKKLHKEGKVLKPASTLASQSQSPSQSQLQSALALALASTLAEQEHPNGIPTGAWDTLLAIASLSQDTDLEERERIYDLVAAEENISESDLAFDRSSTHFFDRMAAVSQQQQQFELGESLISRAKRASQSVEKKD